MQITYSPAYTIVPTYECFNQCTYCNFRVNPGADSWMTLDRATKILTDSQGSGICEILILSGEIHPQSSRRKDWIDLIYDLCKLALDQLGFYRSARHYVLVLKLNADSRTSQLVKLFRLLDRGNRARKN